MWLWVSRFGTRKVPNPVAANETVIRVVTTWHVNSRGLSHELFKNRDDRVSVSRASWVEPWLAKLHGRARVENRRLSPPKLYTGLAFVRVSEIRDHGSEVVDSREEYLGHADLRHGIATQKQGVALPPNLAKALNDRAKAIAKSATYVADPRPSSLRWRPNTLSSSDPRQ